MRCLPPNIFKNKHLAGISRNKQSSISVAMTHYTFPGKEEHGHEMLTNQATQALVVKENGISVQHIRAHACMHA